MDLKGFRAASNSNTNSTRPGGAALVVSVADLETDSSFIYM